MSADPDVPQPARRRRIAAGIRRKVARRSALAVGADTRLAMAEAVVAYTAVRGGTGSHAMAIPAELRDGTPVRVLLELHVLPDPSPAATEEP